MAHRWVAKMKIVPGGERERLRDTLEHALAEAEPVRLAAMSMLTGKPMPEDPADADT